MPGPTQTPAGAQAKAIVGGVLAGFTALGTALADNVVTSAEWVGVIVAALGVYASVFGVRNRDA